ncbi:hypothetical protein GCM10010964_43660 [Caldovatus sediminis]|uniref:Bacteriophage tail tape measure N-terminal domain-containing protein n=1 Tax=Caldovatus sediminis TaxID=2041189 RepID=A0A8J2ZFK5_9PROT|nr:phage tail length tape measure family protein [Caldovatus sediminis]GGG51749.1 hypothetical protein GCM10010964_43660 [Caldovatus sediminis]
MAQSYSFRLSAEGLEQFRQQMQEAARSNEDLARAWETLRTSSPSLVSAMERAQQATDRAAQRTQGYALETERAAQNTGVLGRALAQVGGQVQGFAGQLGIGSTALSGFSQAGTAGMSALGVAAAAATAAVATLATTMAAGVRAAEEFERLGMRTDAVLRATGHTAGLTAEQIRAMSQEIARGTLASTEGVEAAAQKLLTFRSIAGQTFERALRAAQDLAAVGFGTIESAAVQLGRALDNPAEGLSALTRIGVVFTAEQKRVIEALVETGEVAEAQRVILEALERRVGGAGAAEAGGLAGAYDTLSQNVQEFLVRIGNLGPLQAATAAINGLAAAVGALDGALKGVIGFYSAEAVAARAVESARAGLATAQGGAAGARRGAVRQGLLGVAAEQAGESADAVYQQQVAEAARRLEEAEIRLIEIQERAERERTEVAIRGAEERARIEAEAARGAYEALRESTDRRIGIERAYQREVTTIRRALASGVIELAEAEQQLAAALQRRDEALQRAERSADQAARAARGRADQAAREAQRLAEQQAREQQRFEEQQKREWQRAIEEQRRAVERAEEARQRQAERVTDSIVNYASDRFADLFSRNSRGWQGMLETFERTFRSLMARIAAEAIIRPVVQPIVAGLFGDAGAVSILGPLFGGGGGRSVLVSPAGGVLGYGAPVSLGGEPKAGVGVGGGGGGLFGVGGLNINSLGYLTSIYRFLSGQGIGSVGIPLIDSFLQAPVFGSATAAAPGTLGLGSVEALQAALPAGPLPVLTYGSALSGLAGIAGGAYGIYSGLQRGGVGGYTQAAGGALMGASAAASSGLLGAAAAASAIPVYGWIAGAALALASLFLPGAKTHPGGAIILGSTGAGEFGVLDSRSKHVSDFAQIDAQIRQAAGEVNRLLYERGIYVDPAQAGSFGYIGVGPAAQGHPNQYPDIPSMIMGNIHRLRSDNPYVERMLRAGTIGSLEELIGGADWIKNVYEPLIRSGEAVSTWVERWRQLNQTFGEAIESARRLGLAEEGLVEARDRAVKRFREEWNAEFGGILAGLEGRRAMAMGDLALAGGARMRAFDLQAGVERTEFERRLRDLGFAEWNPAEMQRLMAELAEVQRLERERLQREIAMQRRQAAVQQDQIIAQLDLRRAQAEEDDPASRRARLRLFDLAARMEQLETEARLRSLGTDPARIAELVAEMREVQRLERERLRQQLLGQDPASVERRAQIAAAQVTSLADYARSLTYSPLSPLSPQQQFRQAERQFQAVAGAAAAGDWSSIAQLQGYADAYLQAARGVHGSGVGYVEAFRRVTDALERVGEMAPGQLTDAIYREETRRQTDTLREELTALRQEVRRLRAAVEQGSRAPARIAA